MVHVTFDVSSGGLINVDSQTGGSSFYAGKVYQRGFGVHNTHHGAGVGNLFRSVWRYLKPYAISAGQAIGSEGLDAGRRILDNIAQGADLKETVMAEGKEGVKKLLDRASNKLQRGSGIGYKRRRKTKNPSIILRPEDLIGKSVSKAKVIKKRSRSDTLGFY